jgi:flagellar L-ring protein precursor FlgH
MSATKALKRILTLCACLFTLLLPGCSVIPSSIVNPHNPSDTSHVIYPQPGPQNGAIYSVAQYRSMFEGRRASQIGDILTVVITENTVANKNEAGNSSKKSSVTVATTDQYGNSTLPTFGTNSARSLQEAGDANNTNSFLGTIAVTVVDVKPNGNLVVTGEKQVAFDQGVEFVRVSGIVNPYTITNANTVASNTIADARLEYRTNSTFDFANFVKRLNRFFLSASPI